MTQVKRGQHQIDDDKLQGPPTSPKRMPAKERVNPKVTEEAARGEDEPKVTEEAARGEDEPKVTEEAAPGEDEPKVTEEAAAGEDEPKHRAVVFDLDETAGSWGLGSIAYKMYIKFTGKAPPVDVFVRYYFERGGARPWLKQLLKTLEEWKRLKRIDEVAIFTAASNTDGWVTYLRECMEEYAHTPGLFQACDGTGRQLVIARENSPLTATPSGGLRTVKDLSLISPDAEHVVLIDDKPEYVLNGYVIGVPEYTQDVCITELKAWMKAAIPNFADKIESIFAEDEAAHPPNAIDFSKDDALWNAAQVLNTIFPEIVIPPPPNSFTKTSTDDKAFKFDPMHIDPPEGENPEMPRH